MLLTDSNRTVVSELRYTAWGTVRYTSGTTPTKYTYTGQYSNVSDFGLMYYGARWPRSAPERGYDPALGRFAQTDSIVPGGVQGYDRYAYVTNDPVRFTDPDGHKECDYKCQIKYEMADPFYEHYGEALSCWGPEECWGIKPDSVVSKAFRGNGIALLDTIVPTDYGLRAQGEVVFPNLPRIVPGSVTFGMQVTFNRNDGNLVLSMDGAAEYGPTWSPELPVGASATGGGVLGWASSDIHQNVSGQSFVTSGTVAGGEAISAAVTWPANLQADPKYGVVPTTFYLGGGNGAGYVSGGTGIVFSMPVSIVNIYQLLGIRP